MIQLELFPPSEVAVPTKPPIESARARLNAALATLRSASQMPWTAKEVAFWKVVFPQMSKWLPAEERRLLCDEFARLVLGFEAGQG